MKISSIILKPRSLGMTHLVYLFAFFSFVFLGCDPNGETVPFWWKDLMSIVQPAALAFIGYLAMKGNSKANAAVKTAEKAHDAAAKTSDKIDSVKEVVDQAAIRREEIAVAPVTLDPKTIVVVDPSVLVGRTENQMTDTESNG